MASYRRNFPVIRVAENKEAAQDSTRHDNDASLSEADMKEASIRCITVIMDYFAHQKEVEQHWPHVGVTLKSLSAELQKLQRDTSYQSRIFPMLNSRVVGLHPSAHEKKN